MPDKTKTKVLLYDLETSYLITKTWGIYEQDVIGQGKGVIEDFQILCFSYKWLGEKAHVIGQDDFKNYKPGVNDDQNVVKELWKLFNEADITIAHNGDKFDYRKTRARMAVHGLKPHSPTIQIDTKKMAKKEFGFTSNKLDDLARYFGIPGKIDTGGIETWDGCMKGDPKAWAKMKRYNRWDTILLEKVYLCMRAWSTNHPNMANIEGRPEGCPRCLYEGKFWSDGYRPTKTGRYRRWTCPNCGFHPSDRKKVKEEGVKYV